MSDIACSGSSCYILCSGSFVSLLFYLWYTSRCGVVWSYQHKLLINIHVVCDTVWNSNVLAWYQSFGFPISSGWYFTYEKKVIHLSLLITKCQCFAQLFYYHSKFVNRVVHSIVVVRKEQTALLHASAAWARFLIKNVTYIGAFADKILFVNDNNYNDGEYIANYVMSHQRGNILAVVTSY